jgi:CRISPR/Cas system CMR subunit Cmr4 (Cas7 group RAMP superfamily)
LERCDLPATIGDVTEEEFLRRIDGHLEVANEHMARGNEIMARSNEIMARSNEIMARNDVIFEETRAALAQSRQSIDDMRVELRQTSMRGQRVAEQFEAEVRRSREQRAEERAEDRTLLSDLLAEGRAGRDALFVILDELRGRGRGPAPAGA